MLGAPIPWFAGSKGKGLSRASLCLPQSHPSPSCWPPCRGRFLGQVTISFETQLPHLWNDGLWGNWEKSFQESLRNASWHKCWLRVRA